MKTKILVKFLMCLSVWVAYSVSSVQAAVINANPSNYQSLVDTLQPGDTLQLATGQYSGGLGLRGLHGEPGNEIIIQGPQSGDAAIFYGNACCNTVQLADNSYLVIRYLTLDGQNIDYIDAVNSRDNTHHITVEHLLIINHGGSSGPNTDSQGTVGISTKGPAWDWTIRYNTIIEAGTGMYLGNSNGAYPFVRGAIEYNLIYDTLGYNIEIKHQIARPTDIGLPTGDNKTIIRHNVFSKAHNYSTSDILRRPNVLVGHWPVSGTGSNDLYEIYGNFFLQNPSEVLFQGEGNLAFYNNVLINDFGRAIHIAPHNDVPKDIAIFYNTVVSSDRGINVSNPGANYTQFVTGNAVFSNDPISAPQTVVQADNITDTYQNAVNYLINPTSNGTLNPYPVAGMLAGDAMNTSNYQTYSDSGLDFNGTVRSNIYRGAYSGEGSNPGWLPVVEIKSTVSGGTPSPPPGTDPDPNPGTDPTDTGQTSNDTAAASGAYGLLELLVLMVVAWRTLLSKQLFNRRPNA